MKKYTFRFHGRQTGAIGIFYNITDSYEASTLGEAKSMLWMDYEHIRMFKVTENKKDVTDQYDKAEFIYTDYKGKGILRK